MCVSLSFTDWNKSSSVACRLMMDNECWVSFNAVESEKGTTAYKLQMYGKFYNKTTEIWIKIKNIRVPAPSQPFSITRMSRDPKYPHDHSGGLPFCCLHRPDIAGCVESSGVGPRPERGGPI